MSISKFNKNINMFTFEAPEDFQYKKMKDLYAANGADHVYTILGWFYHTGNFGEQPIFYTPDFYINGPKHMTKACKAIEEDAEAVAQINAGKAGFKLRQYKSSYGTMAYSVEWVDLEEELPF